LAVPGTNGPSAYTNRNSITPLKMSCLYEKVILSAAAQETWQKGCSNTAKSRQRRLGLVFIVLRKPLVASYNAKMRPRLTVRQAASREYVHAVCLKAAIPRVGRSPRSRSARHQCTGFCVRRRTRVRAERLSAVRLKRPSPFARRSCCCIRPRCRHKRSRGRRSG
jgi:hypothetical protein